MNPKLTSFSRRGLLRLAGATTCLAAADGALGGFRPVHADDRVELRTVEPSERKLLFVLCAYGGASIIDAFMPVVDSDVPDIIAAQSLNVFAADLIEQRAGSNFRTPRILDDYGIYTAPKLSLADFLASHGADAAAVAHEVSSVNHTVAQQRSLNGAGSNRGRTLMEAMALRYGGGLAIPSCNMASDGYVRHGTDPSVPLEARHEQIASPLLFGAGTHGFQGVADAPSASVMARARGVRSKLDQSSIFARTFKNDARRTSYLYARDNVSPRLESQSLMEKLLLLDVSSVDPKYGIQAAPLTDSVRSVLPNLALDRVEAQIALGFLMAYHGVSTSVTLGFPTDPYIAASGAIEGAPIAFDFSHSSHRIVQSLMWGRTVSMLDKLISLLKTHDYMGDASLGKMWDRSLVYVATDFGRDKTRPFLSPDWGTAHNLNNGSLLVSPLLKGNAVYGGVDLATCNTYGFDPVSGTPTPGHMLGEGDIYGIIAHALDLDAPGAIKYPAIVRG